MSQLHSLSTRKFIVKDGKLYDKSNKEFVKIDVNWSGCVNHEFKQLSMKHVLYEVFYCIDCDNDKFIVEETQ